MGQSATSMESTPGRRPHGFGRSIQFELTDGERGNLTFFCRRWSLVDDFNRPRSAEAARLLATIALTTGMPSMERVAFALRAQVLMAVCSCCHRLARRFRTVEEVHNTMDRRIDDGGRVIRISYDTVLLRLMEPLAPMFRTEEGKARDKLLAHYLMDQGLQDPALDEIASIYSAKANELNERIRALEEPVAGAFNEVVSTWANGDAR